MAMNGFGYDGFGFDGFGFNDSTFRLNMMPFYIVGFLIMAITVTIIIAVIVRILKQKKRDDNSPRLSVKATVITKRMSVHTYRQADASDMMQSTNTSYFVTFQVESGDRIELMVEGGEYGMLVEGDEGILTFQGSRYLGFARQR